MRQFDDWKWRQDEHQYYDYPIKYATTTTEIIFSAIKPLGRWGPREYWRTEDNRMATGYTKYMDSLEVDSANKVFRQIVRLLY